MSLRYNFKIGEDGSYNFISEQGHNYLIYFSESTLPDSDNNVHIVYNLGFSRDGQHNCIPFITKYDSSVRATILFIINDFFKKYDHKVLIYFCFGDDGYSRQRNIVFNQWSKDLDASIEKYNNKLRYEDNDIYGSLIIAKDNPLKKLILDSFNNYLEELK